MSGGCAAACGRQSSAPARGCAETVPWALPVLERKKLQDRAQVTFVLPADAPPGPVSGVGDFNDWKPGTHLLGGQDWRYAGNVP